MGGALRTCPRLPPQIAVGKTRRAIRQLKEVADLAPEFRPVEVQLRLRALEGLAEDFAADQDVMSQLTSSLAEARSALVDVHLNLGSMYMTHTDYQGALKQANAAIAVDTKSRSARSFRARVASASSESGIEVYGGRIR